MIIYAVSLLASTAKNEIFVPLHLGTILILTDLSCCPLSMILFIPITIVDAIAWATFDHFVRNSARSKSWSESCSFYNIYNFFPCWFCCYLKVLLVVLLTIPLSTLQEECTLWGLNDSVLSTLLLIRCLLPKIILYLGKKSLSTRMAWNSIVELMK